MRLLKRLHRWLSLADELRATKGELALALKNLEAEQHAVTRLDGEKARMASELRLYRRFAGAIDEARAKLGLGTPE